MGTAGQSITLANSIIGVGILAMPFCFQQCGVILATLILLTMGLISRLCCYFLLKSALLARRRNFEFLAFHVFGSAGKLAVEVGIIGYLMGTCIAYFVVVGDLGPQIISKMFNINQSDILRTCIMVIVSLVCVLPLGLLRNVDSLSNVSAATICFYVCLVMKVTGDAGGRVLSDAAWQARLDMWNPAGLLQCVPIFSMALFCQTQLFEIFESMPTLSLEKMNLVTKNAINICTGVYFTLGLFGYIAFCSHEISGNVLMSLSPTTSSDVIKLGFVMSLAFSFPLIIFPCRASLYSFLYKKIHSSQHDHIINHSIPQSTFRCMTVSIIAVSLFIGLLIPNIELVLGLVGSTIGVLICVVFPAACFVNITFKNTNERILAKGILILGLIIMVLGTYANLQAAETKLERYDEKYITQERIDKIVEDFFEKRERVDEVVAKPVAEIIPAVNQRPVIRESEVQPPNPVPPESSNEKLPEINIEKLADENNIKQIIPELVKENAEKTQDTHPRDVMTKLNEAKLVNEENKVDEKVDLPKKPDETKTENDDKLQIMKQQQLIETIKMHGEEHKQLMKEQKEILDKMMKNNQENIQNDDGNSEAQKIAVEGIKQIANMAIQSIGGVSEKPKDVPVNEAALLDKKEAVEKIFLKAAETIEAIQEIKDKSQQPQNNGNNEVPHERIIENKPAVETAAQNQQAQNDISIQNNQPIKANNIAENVINPSPIVKELSKNNKEIVQSVQNIAKIEQQPSLDNNNVNKGGPNVVNNNVARNIQNEEVKDIPNDVLGIGANELPANNIVQNEADSIRNGENNKKLVQNDKNLINNIRIANKVIQKKPTVGKVDKQSNLKQDSIQIRRKREILDCTNKNSLRVEDKEICESIKGGKNKDLEILPNVNLDDAVSMGISGNGIHLIRSLKSFEKDAKS